MFKQLRSSNSCDHIMSTGKASDILGYLLSGDVDCRTYLSIDKYVCHAGWNCFSYITCKDRVYFRKYRECLERRNRLVSDYTQN